MRPVQLRIKRLTLRRPASVIRCFHRPSSNRVCGTMPLLVCALSPTSISQCRSYPVCWCTECHDLFSFETSSIKTLFVGNRPPTRPHETRARSSGTAERLILFHSGQTCEHVNSQLLSNSTQPFVFVGFVVLRQSVIPEHCFRQIFPIGQRLSHV